VIGPAGQEEAKQFDRFCEEHVIAHAAGLVTESLGDMTLACACGAVEEDMLSLFHKGTGAKIPDELVVDFGVEGEVKPLDGLFLFEGGSAQTKRELLAFPSFDLVLDQEIEEVEIAQRGALRLLEPDIEGFHETAETKGLELAYLAQQVASSGCLPLLMDVGSHHETDVKADVSASRVAASIGENISTIRSLPRGEAVDKISQGAAICLRELIESGEAHGVIGVGGSGGTTICAAAMRALPYGIPKMIVSTLASGNTRWHVDISDIIMIPSLLDIGGLNPMLKMVLTNAAHAVAGMVKAYRPYQASGKKVISITMYGTTTPGVSRARQTVEEAGYEAWVFHASGVGGRTMEKMISLGHIHGVMDMTLAEMDSLWDEAKKTKP